jgi:hypothetical protein
VELAAEHQHMPDRRGGSESRDKAVATDNGVEIEHLRTANIRKESRIQEILAERGSEPGLVHIFSAMESCMTFSPWHNKQTAARGT